MSVRRFLSRSVRTIGVRRARSSASGRGQTICFCSGTIDGDAVTVVTSSRVSGWGAANEIEDRVDMTRVEGLAAGPAAGGPRRSPGATARVRIPVAGGVAGNGTGAEV